MEVDWKTCELLEKVEKMLDDHNGENGDLEGLCEFCGSTYYNGGEGVVHKDSCIIKQIREVIRDSGGRLR